MSANQCFFNGNFYQCAVATTAGQSPQNNPASWRKIPVPASWRWVLTQLTYAHLLEMDGQSDKAAMTRAKATGTDRIGLDDLVRREANAEQKRAGTGVDTPYNPPQVWERWGHW